MGSGNWVKSLKYGERNSYYRLSVDHTVVCKVVDIANDSGCEARSVRQGAFSMLQAVIDAYK